MYTPISTIRWRSIAIIDQDPWSAFCTLPDMTSQEFQIEFTYQHIPYLGLVKPISRKGDLWYTVDLESENQETHLQILARPSTSSWDYWDFECGAGEKATDHYDKELLDEVGEAIEKQMVAGSDAEKVGSPLN